MRIIIFRRAPNNTKEPPMPWFAVTVHRTLLRQVEQEATVEVEAEDAAEARKEAERMVRDDLDCDLSWRENDGGLADEEVEDVEGVEVAELEPEGDLVQLTLAGSVAVKVLSTDGKELTAEEIKRALAAAGRQLDQAADSPPVTVTKE